MLRRINNNNNLQTPLLSRVILTEAVEIKRQVLPIKTSSITALTV